MELDGLSSTVVVPPAVTLTFDLFTSKYTQHLYEVVRTQIWMSSRSTNSTQSGLIKTNKTFGYC